MRTHSHRLLAASLVALLATFGAGAANARVARNGVQTNGVWERIVRNGVQTNGVWLRITRNGTQTNGVWSKLATNGTQTNGHQADGGAAKAPLPASPVTPQATTVTLPDGTTLPLR